MSFSRAISRAMSSFHWAGSVRNPSASRSTLVSAIIVAVITSSSRRRRRHVLLATERHRRPEARDLPPREQRVPVDPLEHELPEVVQARLAQQREWPGGCRVAPWERLGVVVEVDEQGLVEARLDEAVRVA